MKDGVRVHSPLYRIVQSVLDQPSIWFGRDRTWCGGQSAVNLAVKSEQIRKPACGTLPRQADSRGCDAVYISVKDVEVDPDFFGERDIPHPCTYIEESPEVFTYRGADRRRREHVLLDGGLIDHIDEFRTGNRSIPIPNWIQRIYRRSPGNIKPIVFAIAT